jgi:hypothetical protein
MQRRSRRVRHRQPVRPVAGAGAARGRGEIHNGGGPAHGCRQRRRRRPGGGFGASGIGRELGPWGLSAWQGIKHITYRA